MPDAPSMLGDAIDAARAKFPYFVPKEAMAPIITRPEAEAGAIAHGIIPRAESAEAVNLTPYLVSGLRILGWPQRFMEPLAQNMYRQLLTVGGRYPGMERWGNLAGDAATNIMMAAMLAPSRIAPAIQWGLAGSLPYAYRMGQTPSGVPTSGATR